MFIFEIEVFVATKERKKKKEIEMNQILQIFFFGKTLKNFDILQFLFANKSITIFHSII